MSEKTARDGNESCRNREGSRAVQGSVEVSRGACEGGERDEEAR